MINTRTINRKLHVHLCTQLYHFVLISSLIKFVSTGGNVISVVFLNRYFEIPEFLLFGKHVIFAACTERINYIITCEDGNLVILNSHHFFFVEKLLTLLRMKEKICWILLLYFTSDVEAFLRSQLKCRWSLYLCFSVFNCLRLKTCDWSKHYK